MSRSVARVVTTLLLPLAVPAVAETLYNQDGVRLSATVQEIDPAAAICRIQEARHSAEKYAKLKPNEGQPLDVWRVELVVANYSGRALDYLNAHLNVTSDWPPCDHWDGPEAHYGVPVVWTGPLMSIQDVGTVEPGEEVRETAFVLAWHEEEPALGRWDINYDFAADAAAAKPSGALPTERPSAPTVSETQREPTPRSLEPEPDQTCGVFWHFDGEERTKTIKWTGDCIGGLANGTGKERFMDDPPRSDEGSYVDGKRHGHWILRFSTGTGVHEGPYVDAEKHGYWTERDSFGAVSEGPYVDGKRHGHWVLRSATRDLNGEFWGQIGGVMEGSFVDGRFHGRWVRRWATGSVTYQCFDNGDEVGCP